MNNDYCICRFVDYKNTFNVVDQMSDDNKFSVEINSNVQTASVNVL